MEPQTQTLKISIKTEPLLVSSILFAEADEQYTRIHLLDGSTILATQNITRLVPKDLPGFIWLTNGHTVRLTSITKVTLSIKHFQASVVHQRLSVTLCNGIEIESSYRRTKDVLNSLLTLPIPIVFHVKNTVRISIMRLFALFAHIGRDRTVEIEVKNAIQAVTFYPRQYQKPARKKPGKSKPVSAEPAKTTTKVNVMDKLGKQWPSTFLRR